MNLLPEDIIYEIGRFLSKKDFRSLLTTSITSITMKYSKSKYLNLNILSSILFVTDNENGRSFRNKVLSQIANPNKQLSLDLSNENQITDVSMLEIAQQVHTLNLSGCSGITDVSMLG